MVKQQAQDGAWQGQGLGELRPRAVQGVLALLFLFLLPWAEKVL